MSETSKSKDFIKDNKGKYGRSLFIKKIIDPVTTGEPDIYAIYKGMPVHAEAKLLHESSYKNTHPFLEIQIHNLSIKAQAGAMCIGILYRGKEVRYLMYDQLKPFLDKSDWDNAKEFNWEILLSNWRKTIDAF